MANSIVRIPCGGRSLRICLVPNILQWCICIYIQITTYTYTTRKSNHATGNDHREKKRNRYKHYQNIRSTMSVSDRQSGVYNRYDRTILIGLLSESSWIILYRLGVIIFLEMSVLSSKFHRGRYGATTTDEFLRKHNAPLHMPHFVLSNIPIIFMVRFIVVVLWVAYEVMWLIWPYSSGFPHRYCDKVWLWVIF